MLSTILAVLPVFLLGSVAVLVREELDFDEAALGLSVSCFFATTALSSVAGGRVADRLGARRTLAIATLMSASSLAGIGLLARSWGTLTAFLILGGAANALAQPASNLALARGVSSRRMGIAFGAKQSAIPLAGISAGLALPVLAVTLGWRAAFTAAALAAAAVALIAPRAISGDHPHRRKVVEADAPRGPLIILALGCMFGSAAGIALGSFLVESAVHSGVSAEFSGLVLALGSVVGVATRLACGWFADRREGGHLIVVAWMLLLGAGGFGLLALSERHVALLVVGTVLCFALAWGWPGLFFLAVVRMNPNSPAAASGMAQAGGAAGGVLGPLLFGLVVAAESYPVAWSAAAISTLLAGVLMVVGRKTLLRHRKEMAAATAANFPARLPG